MADSIYSQYKYLRDCRVGSPNEISEDVLTVQFADGSGGLSLSDQNIDVELDEFDFEVVGNFPISTNRNIFSTSPTLLSYESYDVDDVVVSLTSLNNVVLNNGDCSKLTKISAVVTFDAPQTSPYPVLQFVFFNQPVTLAAKGSAFNLDDTDMLSVLGVAVTSDSNWIKLGNRYILALDTNIPLKPINGTMGYFSIAAGSSFSADFQLRATLSIDY